MTAVVLVGGPGTRLRPLTDDRPKSLVPVLNRPVMEHTIAYLKRFGVEDIVLTLSYLPDAIKSRFGDGRHNGAHLVYCVEEEPMGTSGAVKNAEEYIDGTFVVLNGDIFTDLDLADMINFHRLRASAATISLTWVEDPSAFGVVETDDTRRVKRFIEKPPRAEATSHWINAGIYVLESSVLAHIPAGQHDMFEKGLFPRILELGAPVYGYPYRGYWLDMGTPEKYFSVNMDMLGQSINSPFAAHSGQDCIDYGPGTLADTTANVEPPAVFGEGCRIGRGVHIKGPVIMGRDCQVEAGASISSSILWDNVRIGEGARLDHCIIASGVSIPAGQELTGTVMTVARSKPLQ